MAGEEKKKQAGIKPKFEGFNEDQWEAYRLATTAGNKFHLFYGGAGSGKSWLIMFIVLLRAYRAKNTRHAIYRLGSGSVIAELGGVDPLRVSWICPHWPSRSWSCCIGSHRGERCIDST
ncbi:hypothetical protein ACKU27_27100, partial [Sphingobium yanoikuyae]|uniref:hypothetical protein n=1 Tax=Sphingobium yanoikuyae TaxID=13690 RepID=UPI003B91A79F